MTTVVIADDHPLVRQGLRAVLGATDDITVVGEAADGRQAVRLCVDLAPDVVLMDLQMPQMRGLDATAAIAREAGATKVLVLTMFDDDDAVFAAIQAGAVGYLLKGADGSEIAAAIRTAAAGQAVFGAPLARRMQTWFGRGATNDEVELPELTEREREILECIAVGMTNTQIAGRLFLAPKTVANNVTAILGKLGLATRAQAVARARDAGLGGGHGRGTART